MTDPTQELFELIPKIAKGEVSLVDVLQLHPKMMQKLVDKATGLVQHGKLDEAEKLLFDLKNVDAVSPVLPFMLGACRAKKSDLTGAESAFTEGLNRAERIGFSSMIPRVRICRAQVLLELGRFAEARDDLAAVAQSSNAPLALEAKTALERFAQGA
jgi:hypothetical protein